MSTSDDPVLVAELYERCMLDCLMEIVCVVSVDFIDRPRHYRSVSRTTAKTLEDFRYRVGTDPRYPDHAQRMAIYMPIVGVPHQMTEFNSNARALQDKALILATQTDALTHNTLREAVRDEVITFRAYLAETELSDEHPQHKNHVTLNGYEQIIPMFDHAVCVLLDKTLASVFGQKPAPTNPAPPNWPLRGIIDANGARLVEEISNQLKTRLNDRCTQNQQLLTQSQFTLLQWVGNFGAQVIRQILTPRLDLSTPIADLVDPAASLFDSMFERTFRWKTAIDALYASVQQVGFASRTPYGSMAGAQPNCNCPP
jgi:hypothetical protein